MCQNKFEYFLLEMHHKINNNFARLTISWRPHCSSRPQQLFVNPWPFSDPHSTRDYLSTPWMVQLTPGVI